MTRKSYLLRSLAVLSLLTPLASVADTAAFENGFYYGAKLGAQHTMVSWDQTSSLHMIDFDIGDSTSSTLNQDGQSHHTNVMGNLGVGYARIFNQFFLAAEFSVNLAEEQEFGWHSAQTVTLNDTEDTSTLFTNSIIALENPDIILDLRPGFLLAKNFLLYGRVGLAYNQLSLEENSTLALANGDNLTATSVSSTSEEKDVFAWRAGLGMEYKFTPNLALNIDYVFTDYGNIDPNGGFQACVDSAADIAICPFVRGCHCVILESLQGTSTTSSSAEVTKSTATAGFNWYFGGNSTSTY